jgi:hypothetical protein
MNNYPDESYGPSAHQQARSTVAGPAIGLIVTGILMLLLAGWNLIGLASGQANIPAQFNAQRAQINQDPNVADAQKKDAIAMLDKIESIFAPAMIGLCVLIALSSIVIIVGGFKLKNLSGRGWAKSSAILSMLPTCTFCGCLLGLPIGIWALVAMGKPEVKAAFEANKRRPTEREF